jgi:hypothetical protein
MGSCSLNQLMPIDVVTAVLMAAAQRHLDHETGGGKTDHDGREHQGLGQRIGHGIALREDGWRRAPQPAHGEDEDIDGVPQQGQADHHREGAPAQQQVDAAGRHPADAGGHEKFHRHAVTPLSLATSLLAAPTTVM